MICWLWATCPESDVGGKEVRRSVPGGMISCMKVTTVCEPPPGPAATRIITSRSSTVSYSTLPAVYGTSLPRGSYVGVHASAKRGSQRGNLHVRLPFPGSRCGLWHQFADDWHMSHLFLKLPKEIPPRKNAFLKYEESSETAEVLFSPS